MISERIYRLLLKAYPASYLREYAEPMVQHFRDQLREAAHANKKIGFWFRMLADLARTVPRRHLESWFPRHGNFRFSNDARQAIFFARYEASSFSRPEITVEHLLLGLLRSDSALQSKLGEGGVAGVVRRIEGTEGVPRRVPPSEDLRLGDGCKLAIKEAAALGEAQVTTKHLIRAILRQETTLAARILRDYGID